MRTYTIIRDLCTTDFCLPNRKNTVMLRLSDATTSERKFDDQF
ncbi:hypothetical protein Plhal304r1_c008g0032391 [Plasmopara halstedii]